MKSFCSGFDGAKFLNGSNSLLEALKFFIISERCRIMLVMTADLLLEMQDAGMGVAFPISIIDLGISTVIAVFFNLILAGGGMLEVINEMTVEIDGADIPACVAESVLRIVF